MFAWKLPLIPSEMVAQRTYLLYIIKNILLDILRYYIIYII